MRTDRSAILVLSASTALTLACSEGAPSGPSGAAQASQLTCSVPLGSIHRGSIRGQIPALTNPPLVRWGDDGTGYLQLDDRVAGVVVDGQPIAIPLKILWWHEIVNLDTDGGGIAVTHCPLTGSTLAFDRAAVQAAPFDVTGLLYENNLMMADLGADPESLWPQMARGARCGPKDGTPLPMVPVVEMTWDAWRALHPGSRVVSSATGHRRDYTAYPYGDYADDDNYRTLFPVSSLDLRRHPKERTIGIPDGAHALVFPFGALEESGARVAVHGATSGGDYVLLWDAWAEGAVVLRPRADGRDLSFHVEGDRFYDEETGSEWRIDGLSIDGPLAGARLERVDEAFVAFWFAWPLFYPDAELWRGP